MEKRVAWHFKGTRENLEKIVKMITHVTAITSPFKGSKGKYILGLMDYDDTRAHMLSSTATRSSWPDATLARSPSGILAGPPEEVRQASMSHAVGAGFKAIGESVQIGAEVYHRMVMDPNTDFEDRLDLERNDAGFPQEIKIGDYFEDRSAESKNTPKTVAWTKPYELEASNIESYRLDTMTDRQIFGPFMRVGVIFLNWLKKNM